MDYQLATKIRSDDQARTTQWRKEFRQKLAGYVTYHSEEKRVNRNNYAIQLKSIEKSFIEDQMLSIL